MRSLLVLLVAFPAFGHIKLTSPGSFQVTDALGGPNKDEPCGGAGVASGVVTTVMAGSQLTVTWTEPIYHPGHFRIGIASSQADFVTPTPVVMNNDCKSAPIASPVTYPTLVDGLFSHDAPPSTPWTTTVTVPMMACDNCTLQLMQFMSSHTPGCFYFQCAALRIVMPDAGQPIPDAGMGDAGASGGGGTDAGTGGNAVACGASSCAGCCVLGRCEPGNAQNACGLGGSPCTACTGATSCENGMCQAPPPGCSCTAAPSGLLVLALGLLALGRARRATRR